MNNSPGALLGAVGSPIIDIPAQSANVSPMNVFVTGGAGYIGSICTEQLLDSGHAVTVYDNLSEGHRSAVDSRAKFVPGKPEEAGDILNAVKAAKAEAIIHFAGSILVGESMKEPGKY